MDRQETVQAIQHRTDEIHERFGVRELLLFGSVARNEARDSSDVDIIVDFVGPADFDRFMGLRFYLEDILERKVDLVTRKALRAAIREKIEEEAIHVA